MGRSIADGEQSFTRRTHRITNYSIFGRWLMRKRHKLTLAATFAYGIPFTYTACPKLLLQLVIGVWVAEKENHPS